MPQLLIIVFILLALAVSSLGGFFDFRKLAAGSEKNKTETQISEQAPKNKIISGTKISSPQSPALSPVSVETLIKYGPLDKEVFDDTNTVLFEFEAKVSPPETKGQISYETKVEGLDKNWQTTNSTERSINLPNGFGEYTFLVRAKINNVVDQTPDKRTFTISVSPYFREVRISSLQLPTYSAPSLISLSSQSAGTEKINITGWKIEGKNGTFTIPQGVEKYDSLNPLLKNDITVKSGDRIYVSSASSPLGIGETNFRPNKCLGYLTDSNNFTIPVYKSCPQPRTDRLPRYLSENCQKYIMSRSSCESMPSAKLKSWGIFDDSGCLSYIGANFNYPSCFSGYSSDSDFAFSEWHIYMNRFDRGPEIMDMKKDTIYLRDKNGLPVDKYKYDY